MLHVPSRKEGGQEVGRKGREYGVERLRQTVAQQWVGRGREGAERGRSMAQAPNLMHAVERHCLSHRFLCALHDTAHYRVRA